MEIKTQTLKRCDLIQPVGRVDSSTAPKLAEAMDAVTNAGRYRIVLDMSGLDYMSSAGMRILITTQKKCKQYNRGEVILALVPQRIYEALELAGFLPLFRFYDNLPAAIGHF
jgi:anti-sigma B factor antagonist